MEEMSFDCDRLENQEFPILIHYVAFIILHNLKFFLPDGGEAGEAEPYRRYSSAYRTSRSPRLRVCTFPPHCRQARVNFIQPAPGDVIISRVFVLKTTMS